MSYCRLTEGDVYAYECEGGVQFYVSGDRKELDRLCNTFNEAYGYALTLRDQYGLDVPDHAIEALRLDALDEAANICGPDGIVTELKAENERLREELERAYDPQRIRGQADPESFTYAIEQLREFRWQHATNDTDAIPYINKVASAHERETKRLRELTEELKRETEQLQAIARELYEDQCYKYARWKYLDRLKELGVIE